MKLRLLTDTWAKVQPTVLFFMAALTTFAFGAGKFSIDRLLQPWFDRITGNSRLSS